MPNHSSDPNPTACPLRGIRVLDFSTRIAGAYCTKLFADAGADVIKVESLAGDPLRHRSATGADLCGEDGALFRFLCAGMASVVGAPDDAAVCELIAGADLVVESLPDGELDAAALCAAHPGLVVLSISPFGRSGPWAGRPATELTVQAESGSLGGRGLPTGVPFQAGGSIAEWVSASFGAVAALAAVHRARRSGHGEHIDLSLLEAMCLSGTTFLDLFWSLFGRPEFATPARSVETPSIEPTADGYVGFCTNTGQQFRDFLVLIERPDLLDDAELALVVGRMIRFDEWNDIVRAWTTRHSTEEIVERAAALRIPVAPVLDGDSVRRHPHLVARGVFRRDPSGFIYPRPAYRIDAQSPPVLPPAPRRGAHTGRVEPRAPQRPAPSGEAAPPLAGLRALDITNWWAGPSATHVLALLGAEVIHLESMQKPDGARFAGGAFVGRDQWWEYSPFFLAANANKRGLTLNLADPRGLELARQLIEQCDAVVENYTPRVLDGFGLGWESIHAINPRAVLVRMPAFGLDGPWRDHSGFAQTMEQISGLAWVTGHPEDQPRIQRGPCDPMAGMHAAFALLVALQAREQTGAGALVEVPMVESALNAAAEQVIEFTAYGRRMERQGNRSHEAAPQGLYRCAGEERWLALSVATEEQWRALVDVLGHPEWTDDTRLLERSGRQALHDRIDEELNAYFAGRELDECVERLIAAGVPAAALCDPRWTSRHPQMAARGFFEECDHPVVGRHPLPTLPFRLAGRPHWLRSPAPTLGEHNREILRDMLGLDSEQIAALERDGVIGTRPKGL